MLWAEYVGNNPASQKFSILSGPSFKTVPREKTEYTMAKDVEKEENCRKLSSQIFNKKTFVTRIFLFKEHHI